MDVSNVFLNDEVNSVELVGVVSSAPTFSHEFDDIKYYSIRLDVKRSSTSKKVDNLHVFITEDKLVIDKTLIDIGVRLQIDGYLVQSTLQGRSDLSVVSSNVELTDDDDDLNIVYLKGKISRVYDTKQIANTSKIVKSFVVHHSAYICNKKRSLSALVNCWNTTARVFESTFAVDDTIVIRGQLERRLANSANGDQKALLHQISAVILYNLEDNKDQDKE